MGKECYVCGKKKMFGNKVSHSNRKTRTSWDVNLQTINILVPNKDGKNVKQKAKVCTNCIKSNKILKG